MRGGQVFMDSLVAHGVECIFGNPGTTENSLLDRLIDYPDIRYYVALHEGVAVGAATFYAHASGKPGVVNLHVAPGLGNGIGMMYGALKAGAPLVVTAGQQDTRMRLREPLLAHDLAAMAAPVCKWSTEPRTADEIGPTLRRAFKIANDPPRGPVFVALPVDVMEQKVKAPGTLAGAILRNAAPPADGVARLTALLLESERPAIVAGDDIAAEGAHALLVQLAEAIGAPVFHEGLRGQLAFPNRHPNHRGRVPFEASRIRKSLERHDVVLLLGGPFFEELWYDGDEPLPEKSRTVMVQSSHQRAAWNFPVDLAMVGSMPASLRAILEALGAEAPASFRTAAAARNAALAAQHEEREQAAQAQLEKLWDATPMAPARALHEIARALPEGTVVVDESITASLEVGAQFDYREPGDYFAGRGGGIGQGLAGAIGAQVARPDRRVLALSGDGSAMYSIQALWTAAHHDLPIVFVILSNREYRVLKHNLDEYRQRFDAQSNKPYPHMDLTAPELDFPALARGMGVAGEVVTDAAALGDAVRTAFAAGAPYLLEVIVSGKR